MKLAYHSHKDGFHSKPRIDFNLLSQLSEGIISTSTCIVGKIPSLIRFDQDGAGIQAAYEEAGRFKELFGEDYYLEYQFQGPAVSMEDLSEGTKKLMDDQSRVIGVLDEMSVKMGIKRMVTCDVHYINPEDYYTRWMKMKIRTGGGSKKGSQNSDEFGGDQPKDGLNYHFASPDFIYTIWGEHYQDALINSFEIGEKCDLEIPLLSLGQKPEANLPTIGLPDMEGINSSDKNYEFEWMKRYVIQKFQEKGMAE